VEITKFTHACIRIDDGTRRLVLDPGSFSDAGELTSALSGVDAVLITHEHMDHVNADGLADAAASNSSLRIWCPASVAGSLDALGDRVTVAGPGEEFAAGGFPVRTFGGQHALIHKDVPIVPNVAYLVDGRVLHPGDSFTVAPVPVETLLLPTGAPWLKLGEVLDYLVAVRPRSASQIHDALYSERGVAVTESHVNRVSEEYGVAFEHLEVGATRAL
jgi:L-ascorbate metabolism protein UlaG (beta-lactamase superfamily)